MGGLARIYPQSCEILHKPRRSSRARSSRSRDAGTRTSCRQPTMYTTNGGWEVRSERGRRVPAGDKVWRVAIAVRREGKKTGKGRGKYNKT